jgi:hypothetical protein
MAGASTVATLGAASRSRPKARMTERTDKLSKHLADPIAEPAASPRTVPIRFALMTARRSPAATPHRGSPTS